MPKFVNKNEMQYCLLSNAMSSYRIKWSISKRMDKKEMQSKMSLQTRPKKTVESAAAG